ncbi:tetratricopeptide repeat protein [Actimicrobium antarcticum]|uniref:Sel1 repeat family protein n=1 Tax=Actimicrobium antarcticum TaxID=1051899 RepID=A0ABP7TPN5_9BURK
MPLHATGWICRHRIALVLVLASLIGAMALAWQMQHGALQAAEVDRLRMRAAAVHDPAALAQLRQAAGRGNLAAQRAAASVLLARGDTASVAEGLQFAQAAAQRGDSAAQYLLAKACFDGTSVQRADRPQARQWFDKAAQQGHPQAAYFLGLIYKNGYGVAIDRALAADWFARAAALGNPDAMFMLGNAFLDGDGVVADQTRAVQLFRQAAELEQPLAAQTLAVALRDGRFGLTRDPRQSSQMMEEVEHALHHPRGVL